MVNDDSSMAWSPCPASVLATDNGACQATGIVEQAVHTCHVPKWQVLNHPCFGDDDDNRDNDDKDGNNDDDGDNYKAGGDDDGKDDHKDYVLFMMVMMIEMTTMANKNF